MTKQLLICLAWAVVVVLRFPTHTIVFVANVHKFELVCWDFLKSKLKTSVLMERKTIFEFNSILVSKIEHVRKSELQLLDKT